MHTQSRARLLVVVHTVLCALGLLLGSVAALQADNTLLWTALVCMGVASALSLLAKASERRAPSAAQPTPDTIDATSLATFRSQLNAQLATMVRSKIQIIPILAEQLQAVIQQTDEAAGGLSTAFMGISRQAKNQLKAVQEIFGDITEQTSSNNIVHRTEASLAEIQSNFTTITSFFDKSINHIAGIAQQLGKVEHFADHIKSIGKTTDILALNAAIAAANAGSAGVGFKVIATEVKNLARESTNSIGEIAEITANLSTTIRLIKEELEAVHAHADSISERTDFLFKETTGTLGATLNDAAAKIQRIAQNAEGLSKEVSRAVVSIQFQDITRQRIEHVIAPLHSLNQEVNHSLDKLTLDKFDIADSSHTLSTASLLGHYTMESEREVLKSVAQRDNPALRKELSHG